MESSSPVVRLTLIVQSERSLGNSCNQLADGDIVNDPRLQRLEGPQDCRATASRIRRSTGPAKRLNRSRSALRTGCAEIIDLQSNTAQRNRRPDNSCMSSFFAD